MTSAATALAAAQSAGASAATAANAAEYVAGIVGDAEGVILADLGVAVNGFLPDKITNPADPVAVAMHSQFAGQDIEDIVETGRLSETALNAAYAEADVETTVETGRLSVATMGATWALRPDSGTQAIGQGELFINVRDHGAVGDGVVDDTAAFVAAIAAAPVGGMVFVPVGAYLLGDLVITKALTIVGIRGDGNTGSRLIYSGAGTFISTTKYIGLEGLTIMANGSKVGKTGILVDGNPPGDINQLSRLFGVLVANFDYGVKFTDCVTSVLLDSSFADIGVHGASYYYAGGDDAGDHTISGCLFTGAAAAHVYIESSAGHKISDCKMIFGQRAIDVQSTKTGLSVLTITGNSLEAQSVESIRIDQKAGFPAGTISWLTITGNEIAPSAGGGAGLVGIRLGLGCYGFTITGNFIASIPGNVNGRGIICGAVHGTITGNQFAYCEVGIDFRSGTTGTTQGSATVADNSYLDCNTYVAERVEFDAITRGFVDHTYRVNLGAVAAGTTNLTIFELSMANFASCIVTVTFGGLVQGVGNGAVALEKKFALRRDDFGVYTATVLQNYESIAAGGAGELSIQLDASIGVVYLNQSVANGYNGWATINVKGSPVLVKRRAGV